LDFVCREIRRREKFGGEDESCSSEFSSLLGIELEDDRMEVVDFACREIRRRDKFGGEDEKVSSLVSSLIEEEFVSG
jgi:hypothetical protein